MYLSIYLYYLSYHYIYLCQVAGNLETKYKCKDYGLTVTEKWATDNTLCTTIDVEDKLMPGLKVTPRFEPPPRITKKISKILSRRDSDYCFSILFFLQ